MRGGFFLPWNLLAGFAFAALVLAGQPARMPEARRVEVKGMIHVVSADGRGGPPSLVVKSDDQKNWTVYLGSIRYLIDQNFNPKAGERIELVGFSQAEGEVAAAEVTLPASRKTLRLRDAEGKPLWRGPHKRSHSHKSP
ncbi:MAG: hypothetical protein JNL98_01230 [Bryobacterales bacterium]|nr:hypothetical protein [Bryobacterales bacterium]